MYAHILVRLKDVMQQPNLFTQQFKILLFILLYYFSACPTFLPFVTSLGDCSCHLAA